MRPLLVEDEAALAKRVVANLARHGMTCEWLAQGEDAVDFANDGFTVLVVDVGLPGMNGRQLADIARAARPDLPILFVTGYAENATIRADFLSANMAMITKPFTIETLSGRISEVLSSDTVSVGDPAPSVDDPT